MIKRTSIRLRLTLWYLAVFSAGIVAINVTTWFALRASMMENRQNALEQRLVALAQFLENEALGNTLEAIQEEAREYSSGLPAGHKLSLWDVSGNLIFERAGTDLDLLTRKSNFTIRGHPVTVELGVPLQDFYATLGILRRIMIGLMPLVLIAAAFGGWWLAGRALEPVDKMTREARSIQAQDLGARLSVPATGDELERLAQAWNDLLSRIESSVRGVIQFTADAAHELRTPVAVVRTSAEVALRQERSGESYRNTLSAIQTETVRMTELLDQLLLLARGDSGKLQFQFDATTIVPVAKEACRTASTLAGEKGIHIQLNVPEQDLLVWADPGALQRLMLILLDNAIKFTPAGGQVSVRVRPSSTWCLLEVEDNGCGIAEEIRPHIFDRFFRADPARTPRSGAGLGLAIARTIVDAHEGKIEADSRMASGALFRVSLPLLTSPESFPR
jgi:heavy metal sensor kinase